MTNVPAPTFPIAPSTYDQREERGFRGRASIEIGKKLSSSQASILNQLYSGSGSPETVVIANVGSLYLRSDGGAGTTLYVKESGTGNTGWIAK